MLNPPFLCGFPRKYGSAPSKPSALGNSPANEDCGCSVSNLDSASSFTVSPLNLSPKEKICVLLLDGFSAYDLQLITQDF